MNRFATSFPTVTYDDSPRLGFVDTEGNRILRELVGGESVGLDFVGEMKEYQKYFGLEAELVINGEVVAVLTPDGIRLEQTITVPNGEGEAFWRLGDIRSPTLYLLYQYFNRLVFGLARLSFGGTPLVFNKTENRMVFDGALVRFDGDPVVFNAA